MTLYEQLVAEAFALRAAEVVAVAAALLYLLLVIREHIACWYFAMLSTGLYVWVFADARLYMEAALNGFYFAMAIYGWTVWRAGAGTSRRPVVAWPLQVHLGACAVLVLLALVSGGLLGVYSDAVYPYIDSATTWLAVWATFLVARKVYENWWYWLVIDLASLAIFWSRELFLTSLLFGIYVAMIPFGMRAWLQSQRAQAA